MARECEIRRMRKAWATIDSRTLRDIGVSGWDLAHGECGKRRAADINAALLYDRKTGRVSVVPGPPSQAAFPECPVL
jgi:hypothetical protein